MTVYAKEVAEDAVLHLDLNPDYIRERHAQGVPVDEIASDIEQEADVLVDAIRTGKTQRFRFNDSH